MPNAKQRLAYLVAQHLNNQIKAQELDELSTYLRNADMEALLLDVMEKEGKCIRLVEISRLDQQRICRQLMQKIALINASRPVWLKIIQNKYFKGLAASILLITAFGIINFFLSSTKQPVMLPPETGDNIVADKIDEGSNEAVLILANGKRIQLDEQQDGRIDTQGNTSILYNHGQLKYTIAQRAENTAEEINTLIIPKGSKYQLTLSDGTKVWLNTHSKLKYPTSFNREKREINLSGEAYLEVAHDSKRPFVVRAGEATVSVLGTSFNVNAYEGDKVTTTLLKGSVRVANISSHVTMQPNQQAVLTGLSSAIKVLNVDAEEAISWKNGYFVFHDQNIKEVMKTIQQWYDIDIIYQGDVSRKTFGGSVSRYEDITKLLKNIELTGAIHFKIEGREVTVMP